jgi:hypothetical protein
METPIILIITEFITLFFLALGYLIKYRKRLDLIRGYDRGTVKDPAGLSRWVGNNLLFLGVAGIVTFAVEVLVPDLELIAVTLFLAGLVPAVGIITAIGSRRFEGRKSEGK